MTKTAGSKGAALLMLTALQTGCAEDVRVTLDALDNFFPPDCLAGEFERRELLESVGEEVLARWTAEETFAPAAQKACRVLLEHLAGPDPRMISRYVQ